MSSPDELIEGAHSHISVNLLIARQYGDLSMDSFGPTNSLKLRMSAGRESAVAACRNMFEWLWHVFQYVRSCVLYDSSKGGRQHTGRQ